MATVIATDNLPAALSQIAERQDELDARLDALTSQFADQTIHVEEQDEQLRVQAAALRMTATQLSTNIRDIAKARNGNGNGSGNGSGGGNANGSGNGNGNGNDRAEGNNPGRNPGRNGRITGARLGGEANIGPASALAEIGGGLSLPEEPKAPERRRAHRWL